MAAGLDVLRVRLVETAGQATPVQLSLALPETIHPGLMMARWTLPSCPSQVLRIRIRY